jgi:2-polyprenyl-3-methyl-5-hydroxy-6-metoxy-1,4-benzoquinol methylase
MADWYSDEKFWQTFFSVLFTEERFELAEEQVGKILELLQFKGNSILDLACGPGRHSVALAERGFSVTGVDLSDFLLGKAKERADAVGVEIEWIHEDMRNFKRTGAFDLCLSMWSSFGYFEDMQDDLTVLRNIHDSLASGGVFLIDTKSKEVLARHYTPTSSHELKDGTLMIEQQEIIDDWSRVKNRWIMLKEGMAKEYRFEHTVYSGQELKDRLFQTGFTSVKVYGDLDGAQYGPEARRLIAVACK